MAILVWRLVALTSFSFAPLASLPSGLYTLYRLPIVFHYSTIHPLWRHSSYSITRSFLFGSCLLIARVSSTVSSSLFFHAVLCCSLIFRLRTSPVFTAASLLVLFDHFSFWLRFSLVLPCGYYLSHPSSASVCLHCFLWLRPLA